MRCASIACGFARICHSSFILRTAYYSSLPALPEEGSGLSAMEEQPVTMEMVPVAVEAMGHVDVPPGIMSLGKDELAKILSDNGMDAASVTSIAGPEVTEIKSATGRDPSETATFNGFSSLVSVSFPAVTSIGDWAFMQYSVPSPLIDVDCPAATSIGQGAFAHSGSLTSIHFPAATRIADKAFVGCTSLESVDFPAAVSIGDNAFMGCNKLTSVRLPAVANIGVGAFQDCGALDYVNIPAEATIGYRAFYRCNSLQNPPLASLKLRMGYAVSDCCCGACQRVAFLIWAIVCCPPFGPYVCILTEGCQHPPMHDGPSPLLWLVGLG